MPKFSVIIPCFNAQDTIRQTIDAIRAQTYTNWEIICVDDGSSDCTVNIIAAMVRKDHSINVVRNPGKGPSAARNFAALQYAKGQYLAFCDADDIWHPDKLAQLETVFKDTRSDAAFAQVNFFNHHPGDTPVRSRLPHKPLTIASVLAENPLCTLSNLTVKRSTFQATDGFDEAFVHNEDLDWLVRALAGDAQFAACPNLQVYYRNSPNGLSANLSKMQQTHQQIAARMRSAGVDIPAQTDAAYSRYLARRALRMGSRTDARRYCLDGLRYSLIGFFSPARRGFLTCFATLVAQMLPATQIRRLFS